MAAQMVRLSVQGSASGCLAQEHLGHTLGDVFKTYSLTVSLPNQLLAQKQQMCAKISFLETLQTICDRLLLTNW